MQGDSQEYVLIDKLEDQLIDNPDINTRNEFFQSSIDETFQKKLNDRADEIARNFLQTSQERQREGDNGGISKSANSPFIKTRRTLDFEYSDVDGLRVELEEWFCNADLDMLQISKLAHDYDAASDKDGRSNKELVTQSIERLQSYDFSELKYVLYFSFGQFEQLSSIEDQLNSIISNNYFLFNNGLPNILISILKRSFESRKSLKSSNWINLSDKDYFILLTLLYFLVNVILLSDSDSKANLRRIFVSTNFLTELLSFIELSKWSNKYEYKMRNLLLLFWKSLLIEMGGQSQIERTDEFLNILYNISGHSEKSLQCSTMDYMTFREDMLDKFPLSYIKDKNFDFKLAFSDSNDTGKRSSPLADCEYFMALHSNSHSIANYLSAPHPNRINSNSKQLPSQTIHIATPVETPIISGSDFLSGEKIRKLYQVNQSFPFIYPSDFNMEVPVSIKEAEEIYERSLFESYSNKRLRDEKDSFMANERAPHDANGNSNDTKPDFEKLLQTKFPQWSKEIESLSLIEKFYANNLSRLNTLVEIFFGVLLSNRFDFNLNFAEWELNRDSVDAEVTAYADNVRNKETIDFFILQKLELKKIKEISLKVCSNIIHLLLRWLKLSHIIKYYYLTSLMYDQNYFNLTFDYLGECFESKTLKEINNNQILKDYASLAHQNQLMNPKISIPRFEFFSRCLADKIPQSNRYELINKTAISSLEEIVQTDNEKKIIIKKYNKNFCTILSNMLNIADDILIDQSCQRVFSISELKLTEFFRLLLDNFDNSHLRTPIFRILKKIVPYQGRKWKSLNMDMISLIYLNCDLTLKDDWLSGKDLENDFNSAYEQETAIRALIEFYNSRYIRSN